MTCAGGGSLMGGGQSLFLGSWFGPPTGGKAVTSLIKSRRQASVCTVCVPQTVVSNLPGPGARGGTLGPS